METPSTSRLLPSDISVDLPASSQSGGCGSTATPQVNNENEST
jgi:hypothetical protein